MDSTSKRWKNRLWQGKLAAGFANSGGLSGDKLAVLQQLNILRCSTACCGQVYL